MSAVFETAFSSKTAPQKNARAVFCLYLKIDTLL